MIDFIADHLGDMPRAGVIALLVVLALQISLQIFALVDLARRPAVRGGKKWVWAIVIIAVSLLGAILYLAIGRTPDAEQGPDGADDSPRTTSRDALDRLYGSSGEKR
jgi:hypothetical protein